MFGWYHTRKFHVAHIKAGNGQVKWDKDHKNMTTHRVLVAEQWVMCVFQILPVRATVCVCVSWRNVRALSNCLLGKVVVSAVTKQSIPYSIPLEMCVCFCVCVCTCYVCVIVYVSETETEDIIYSLSGRAIICKEGLYCQLCQHNRIGDIPAEVPVCVCVCLPVTLCNLDNRDYSNCSIS